MLVVFFLVVALLVLSLALTVQLLPKR